MKNTSDRARSRGLLRTVLRNQRRKTIVGGLMVTSHQVCEALVPLAIGLTIDQAVATGVTSAMIIAVLGVLGLFAVLAFSAAYGYRTVDAAAYEEAHRLRTDAVHGVLADPKRGADRRTGELLSIATSDALAAAEITAFISTLFAATAGIAVSVVVLLRVDLFLGIALIVVVPLLLLGVDRLSPWLEQRLHAQQQTGGLAAATAAELVAGLRPLRGFGGVGEATRRYGIASRASLDATRSAATASSVVTGSGLLATGLVMAGTSIAAVLMALAGRITVGELVTVVAMASFLADPVRTVAACIGGLAAARASASRLVPLLGRSEPESVADGNGAGPLIFDRVGHGPVRGLDLTVGSDTMIGIAYADPAAATTVLGLITGSTEPEAGAVTWAGRPTTEVPQSTLRRQLLAEPHATELLGGTLGAAMRTGDRPDPALRTAALAAAGADDVLTSLRSGTPAAEDDLDRLTLLDQAANLSGGQRQRVALARAIAAGRPVLVLHDPLTAVDAVTEEQVSGRLHEARQRITPGAATIVITTSPALLSRCDQVAWLPAAGPARIADHDQLLAEPDYAAVVLR
ncbi:ABC transporter transmembrane domain-containing protein [Microlunatus speluncae]|uniref:ABC transporter transmembrane domain-containing protein n=1 Tax=Microlunatus speluncae TaxID=2594267 RepID=UPI0012665393|nr:ABC transporter ATP-binding protein [Microlunatus speluncae]